MTILKKILLVVLLAAAFIVTSQPGRAQAQEGYVTSTASFFEPLSTYGDWYYTDAYGWVWTPYQVQPTWRPYTVGSWVWTDAYGWMWTSEEPWAWATYHYGRWAFLDGVWVWVPDTVWGPAWVAWSQAESYVGWAPLPPGVSVGAYGGTVNVNVSIGWQSWVYVPAAYMLQVNLWPYYVPYGQVQVIWRRAVPMTRYRIYGGTVMCLGVSTSWVGGWVGYTVPVVQVSWASAPAAYYRHGTVYLYRTPPPPPAAYRYAPPPPQRAVPPAMRSHVRQPPPPAMGHGARQPASPPAPSGGRSQAQPPAPSGSGSAPPPPMKSSSGGPARKAHGVTPSLVGPSNLGAPVPRSTAPAPRTTAPAPRSMQAPDGRTSMAAPARTVSAPATRPAVRESRPEPRSAPAARAPAQAQRPTSR